MAAQAIFAVINMDCFQTAETDGAVKLMQYLFELPDNIIAAVKDVARIEADAQLIRKSCLFYYSRNFFKIPTYFGSFAGHGF